MTGATSTGKAWRLAGRAAKSLLVRRVRGILFLDYVRMLRRCGAPLDAYLQPEDRPHLTARIDVTGWYPMETFERFGLAILGEVVGRETDAIRLWGRGQMDRILGFLPDLVTQEPRVSIGKFLGYFGDLFDFPAITVDLATEDHATVRIDYGMAPAAEEAAAWQTCGFFEALLDATGAETVRGAFATTNWSHEARPAVLNLTWSRASAAVAAPGSRPLPKLLLVDDEPLVLAGLVRILERVADVTCASNAAEAIARLEAAPFDVVLSDNDFGGGPEGLELLALVAQRWPSCGRILHSALPPVRAGEALRRGVLHAVAQKPVLMEELRRLVAETRGDPSPKPT